MKLSLVSSFAQALNEQDTEKESEEDIEAKTEVITFFFFDVLLLLIYIVSGAPNENIVQNHFNIAFFNVF